jgi:hypothetical protein
VRGKPINLVLVNGSQGSCQLDGLLERCPSSLTHVCSCPRCWCIACPYPRLTDDPDTRANTSDQVKVSSTAAKRAGGTKMRPSEQQADRVAAFVERGAPSEAIAQETRRVLKDAISSLSGQLRDLSTNQTGGGASMGSLSRTSSTGSRGRKIRVLPAARLTAPGAGPRSGAFFSNPQQMDVKGHQTQDGQQPTAVDSASMRFVSSERVLAAQRLTSGLLSSDEEEAEDDAVRGRAPQNPSACTGAAAVGNRAPRGRSGADKENSAPGSTLPRIKNFRRLPARRGTSREPTREDLTALGVANETGLSSAAPGNDDSEDCGPSLGVGALFATQHAALPAAPPPDATRERAAEAASVECESEVSTDTSDDELSAPSTNSPRASCSPEDGRGALLAQQIQVPTPEIKCSPAALLTTVPDGPIGKKDGALNGEAGRAKMFSCRGGAGGVRAHDAIVGGSASDWATEAERALETLSVVLEGDENASSLASSAASVARACLLSPGAVLSPPEGLHGQVKVQGSAPRTRPSPCAGALQQAPPPTAPACTLSVPAPRADGSPGSVTPASGGPCSAASAPRRSPPGSGLHLLSTLD